MKKENIIEMIKNREFYMRKIAFLKKQIKTFEATIEQDIYSIVYPTLSLETKVQKPLGDPVPHLASAVERSRKSQEDKLFELRYELLLIQQKMDVLDNAVDILPDDQKTVIKKRFYESVTIKQLSYDMMISYSGIYAATLRAFDNIYDLIN